MADNFKGSRILLVEDEETLAIGLEYNLTEEGYAVKWAKNGREAIEFFESGNFDLIILDIMLPYINGFDPRANTCVTQAEIVAQPRVA